MILFEGFYSGGGWVYVAPTHAFYAPYVRFLEKNEIFAYNMTSIMLFEKRFDPYFEEKLSQLAFIDPLRNFDSSQTLSGKYKTNGIKIYFEAFLHHDGFKTLIFKFDGAIANSGNLLRGVYSLMGQTEMREPKPYFEIGMDLNFTRYIYW